MRTQFSKLALAASLALALALTLSCSSNDDGNNNSGTSSPSSGGGSIVNADNEAWVTDVNKKAYIFKQNGEVIYAKNKNGNWCIQQTGLYSINGNQVTVLRVLYTYRIDENGILSLTWTTDSGSEKQDDFIRTSGVNASACEE